MLGSGKFNASNAAGNTEVGMECIMMMTDKDKTSSLVYHITIIMSATCQKAVEPVAKK